MNEIDSLKTTGTIWSSLEILKPRQQNIPNFYLTGVLKVRIFCDKTYKQNHFEIMWQYFANPCEVKSSYFVF